MPKKITRKELDALLRRSPKRLADVDLTGVDLRAPRPVDFSHVELDNVIVDGVDMSGLHFRGATLRNLKSDGACFDRADFTGASLGDGFVGVSLRGAILRKVAASSSNLAECDLSGADLSGAELEYAAIDTTDARGASFRDTNLRGASFESANLAGADFTGATVDGVRWKRANRDGVIGFGDEGKAKSKSKSGAKKDAYVTTSSLGGPILAVPAELAVAWSGNEGDDYERGSESREGKVTVAGWIETTSLSVGEGRALLLHGAVETGLVPIEDGVVLVRGGAFSTGSAASDAVRAACAATQGWKAHPHPLDLVKGTLWIFDSVAKGARKRDAIEAEFPVLEAVAAPGSYTVDAKGSSNDSGPIAFIRLRKTTRAKAKTKAAAKRATRR